LPLKGKEEMGGETAREGRRTSGTGKAASIERKGSARRCLMRIRADDDESARSAGRLVTTFGRKKSEAGETDPPRRIGGGGIPIIYD